MSEKQKTEDLAEMKCIITRLQQQKIFFQLTGQYQIAQQILVELEEVKSMILSKKIKDLNWSHRKEQLELEKNQNDMFCSFEQKWRYQIEKFNRKMKSELTSYQKTTKEELEKFQDLLHIQYKSENFKSRPSSAALQERQQELELAKQNRFKEAALVKQKRLEIERLNKMHHQQMIKHKIFNELQLKQQQLNKSYEALTDRFVLARAELFLQYHKERLEFVRRQHYQRLRATSKHNKDKRSVQNEIATTLNKCYFDTSHGHLGTAPYKRPWTVPSDCHTQSKTAEANTTLDTEPGPSKVDFSISTKRPSGFEQSSTTSTLAEEDEQLPSNQTVSPKQDFPLESFHERNDAVNGPQINKSLQEIITMLCELDAMSYCLQLSLKSSPFLPNGTRN
ncbi:hypothetical protein RFI_14693 [Reticulomyxa filosa]|uniref:Uncharacterized protein n=1 Tax=Reticulomyxa filosa TaxID=46433 RepID=X6N9B7_RETFI|nr:hypothetical protein RFI_14693 [Reticulomyxa filosa]|eukprot:ETO22508.1 hypothetical protein RFI_14693 [Reticulomyxa filosa]